MRALFGGVAGDGKVGMGEKVMLARGFTLNASQMAQAKAQLRKGKSAPSGMTKLQFGGVKGDGKVGVGERLMMARSFTLNVDKKIQHKAMLRSRPRPGMLKRQGAMKNVFKKIKDLHTRTTTKWLSVDKAVKADAMLSQLEIKARIQASIREAAEEEVVTEVESNHYLKSVAYWRQGDKELQANEKVELRAKLRFDPTVIDELQLWWETALHSRAAAGMIVDHEQAHGPVVREPKVLVLAEVHVQLFDVLGKRDVDEEGVLALGQTLDTAVGLRSLLRHVATNMVERFVAADPRVLDSIFGSLAA